MKLNLKSMALSGGILLAAMSLIVGVWFQLTGYASGLVAVLAEIYGNLIPLAQDGKSFINPFPSIALLTLFTFVDGAILGILFGLFYNLLLPKDTKSTKE